MESASNAPDKEPVPEGEAPSLVRYYVAAAALVGVLCLVLTLMLTLGYQQTYFGKPDQNKAVDPKEENKDPKYDPPNHTSPADHPPPNAPPPAPAGAKHSTVDEPGSAQPGAEEDDSFPPHPEPDPNPDPRPDPNAPPDPNSP